MSGGETGYPVGEMVQPPAFSNGTEHHMWENEYCNRCIHEKAFRAGDASAGCELALLAFMHEPVPAWIYTDKPWPLHVHCLKFSPDDGEPPTYLPRPTPQIPGQLSFADVLEPSLAGRKRP